MKSFVVGREHGRGYAYGAVLTVEDLDGLFAYLTHPTTYQTDHLALHLVERLEIYDGRFVMVRQVSDGARNVTGTASKIMEFPTPP
ncbi:Dabb family protein [Streptomyces sp. RP5T]|uniref:Dabb family protein n=1 Tax=Streptomyces sp. RP5T TaxID=2490848 RepID=UPI0021AD5D9A|nr:Dabb family protein [Streptomyces sp. RP5T]